MVEIGASLGFLMWWALATEVEAKRVRFWNGSGNGVELKSEMETVLLVGEEEVKENKGFSRKRKRRQVEEKPEAIVIWCFKSLMMKTSEGCDKKIFSC